MGSRVERILGEAASGSAKGHVQGAGSHSGEGTWVAEEKVEITGHACQDEQISILSGS